MAPNVYDGARLNDVSKPSGTVAYVEAAPTGSRMEKVTWSPFSPSDYILNQTECALKGSEYVAQRATLLHGGRGNFVFVDGHIENLLWSSSAEFKKLWTIADD